MSVTDQSQEYKKLRAYLNPYIRGKNVDGVLNALATSSAYLVNSIDAVNSSLYIMTAQGQYLDLRLADYGITRDPSIGLSDDVFRQIGIAVKNKKQIRELINTILNQVFSDPLVKATSSAQFLEPYALQDGDTLIIDYDGGPPRTITFNASQFNNIGAALAIEVANAISVGLSNLGVSGSAIQNNSGSGNYVELISDTVGPSSSITVLGGRAQNVLFFPSSVPYSGNFSTQWTISIQSGGVLRFTWSGGADPGIGDVEALQYVNIFGGGFASSSNEGTYTIVASQGGEVNVAYFEIINPIGSVGIVTQGTNDAIRFYTPIRETLLNNKYYAAVYSTEKNVLQIFLPATSQVVSRSRIGSAHIHGDALPDSGPSESTTLGPYIYDTNQGFTIGGVSTTLSADINANSSRVMLVGSSVGFPNSTGYLVLNYGCANQELIPYIAAPSNGSLLISPVYTIKQPHYAGESVLYVNQKSPITLPADGSAYQPYLTDIAKARVWCQGLIDDVSAAGVNVVFTILYPDDIGLGKWGTQYSEISYVYGP